MLDNFNINVAQYSEKAISLLKTATPALLHFYTWSNYAKHWVHLKLGHLSIELGPFSKHRFTLMSKLSNTITHSSLNNKTFKHCQKRAEIPHQYYILVHFHNMWVLGDYSIKTIDSSKWKFVSNNPIFEPTPDQNFHSRISI